MPIHTFDRFLHVWFRKYGSEKTAAAGGIGKSTLYEWLQRGSGEDAESPYNEFVGAMATALAEAESEALGRIEKAAQPREVTKTRKIYKGDKLVEISEDKQVRPGSCQAAAWLLERRSPERWGRSPKDLEARVEELKKQIAALTRGETNQKL